MLLYGAQNLQCEYFEKQNRKAICTKCEEYEYEYVVFVAVNESHVRVRLIGVSATPVPRRAAQPGHPYRSSEQVEPIRVTQDRIGPERIGIVILLYNITYFTLLI